jgi:hypothetical protein
MVAAEFVHKFLQGVERYLSARTPSHPRSCHQTCLGDCNMLCIGSLLGRFVDFAITSNWPKRCSFTTKDPQLARFTATCCRRKECRRIRTRTRAEMRRRMNEREITSPSTMIFNMDPNPSISLKADRRAEGRGFKKLTCGCLTSCHSPLKHASTVFSIVPNAQRKPQQTRITFEDIDKTRTMSPTANKTSNQTPQVSLTFLKRRR